MGDDVVVARRHTEDNSREIAQWCDGELVLRDDPRRAGVGGVAVSVLTATGGTHAWLGDWVVMDVDGTFSVQWHEDFTARHKPVD
jgi:hypothetical protein